MNRNWEARGNVSNWNGLLPTVRRGSIAFPSSSLGREALIGPLEWLISIFWNVGCTVAWPMTHCERSKGQKISRHLSKDKTAALGTACTAWGVGREFTQVLHRLNVRLGREWVALELSWTLPKRVHRSVEDLSSKTGEHLFMPWCCSSVTGQGRLSQSLALRQDINSPQIISITLCQIPRWQCLIAVGEPGQTRDTFPALTSYIHF